jgi:hypothetical protein
LAGDGVQAGGWLAQLPVLVEIQLRAPYGGNRSVENARPD